MAGIDLPRLKYTIRTLRLSAAKFGLDPNDMVTSAPKTVGGVRTTVYTMSSDARDVIKRFCT